MNLILFFKNNELPRNQIGRSDIKFNTMSSGSPQILEFGHFTFLFSSQDGTEMYQKLNCKCRAIIFANGKIKPTVLLHCHCHHCCLLFTNDDSTTKLQPNWSAEQFLIFAPFLLKLVDVKPQYRSNVS